jgi:hypothetical protein
MALALEGAGEHVAQGLVVVDDQDVERRRRLHARWTVAAGGEATGRAEAGGSVADVAEERFEATIATEGSGTFIEVPLDVPAVFGRVRAPVRVTVGGHTWRSTVMRYGDRYVLPLARANREAAGVAAGDTVAVVLASDDAPRTVEVPDDLASALDAAPGARAAFDGSSFSHRREWVEWVAEAKRRDTRERRVRGVVEQVLARG